VAHVYNPSYSGGRNQEDRGSKPAWANTLQDPILKKTHHKKRSGGVAQDVGPEFKSQYQKREREREKKEGRNEGRRNLRAVETSSPE
jgi:hypothetical protein